jgi:mono/diheme cytochrome c family protein
MANRVKRGALGWVVGLVVVWSAACRPAESQESAQGKALFESVCARCHGRDGRGGAAVTGAVTPRNFADPTFQRTRTDPLIRDAIVQGRSNGAMPPFGATFTDEEIGALVTYIRAIGAREERP